MAAAALRETIESWERESPSPEEVARVVPKLLDALENGLVRAAVPDGDGWRVEAWVKTGILHGFRRSEIVSFGTGSPLAFTDKSLFPPRDLTSVARVRLVPGGSAVRRGAFIGPGVVLMPPCYVNVGAYVGEGSMIDSHALVGSCAQIGRSVHLSAGAQTGGVLEPPGAMPVVVEDGAFVGGLAAVLEGVRIGREAVIGAGVVLTASTPVYDLPRRRVIRRGADGVLQIPARAVVIHGSRAITDEWACSLGLAASAAIIVKDRDAGTDARAALEDSLR
jgi:2,3,4,5-tetrahydropyridine-2-carboxylate N-succinyltransferase